MSDKKRKTPVIVTTALSLSNLTLAT